MALSTWS